MNKMDLEQKNAFVGTGEAAELLGVSLRTVQLWVEKGSLKAWKTAGGHRRIARHSLDKLLEQKHQILQHQEQDQKKPLRITIIDDQAELLDYYRLKLELLNLPIEIETTDNGFDALMQIGESRPDIIITDLVMQGMNGFELVEALQNNHKLAHADFIVFTQLNKQQISEHGNLPEDVRIFYKPVDFDALETFIRSKTEHFVAS